MNDNNSKNDNELNKEQLSELYNIEIPESIMPETVVSRLKKEQKKAKRKYVAKAMGAVAAVVVVVGGITATGLVKHTDRSNDIGYEDSDKTSQSDSNAGSTHLAKPDRNKDLGEGLRLASNYSDVERALSDSCKHYYWYTDEVEDVAESADMAEPEVGSAPSSQNGVADLGDKEESDYSKTNVQTEGVDESDYVITDGAFLYYMADSKKVYILDVADGYNTLSTIVHRENIADKDGNVLQENYREMYVDGDRLYLVAEVVNYGWSQIYEEDAKYITDEYCCVYNPVKSAQTILYTYDISDRANPTQIGALYQDGYYSTSRKVQEYVYLFTQFNVAIEDEDYDYTSFIPTVNGMYLEADCIYIEDGAYEEIVISSINTGAPDQVYDSVAVAGSTSKVYMGKSSIYLYGYWYETTQNDLITSVVTSGTKFTKLYYRDGIMNGVGSVILAGDVNDTFAVNEYNDTLRVLVTYSGVMQNEEGEEEWTRTNYLYCVDANMQVVGQSGNIATGESIYAARYMEDKAYFVTYLNHDPVFVADLSDPYNPTVLGNIEISGYSDYLHMYGDNLLLGLGYETDEESRFLGYKVSMFNFNDVMNPSTISSIVEAKDGWGYASAFYNYRDLLVDPEKNLIGYAVQTYDNLTEDNTREYYLYRWNGTDFEKLLDISHSERELETMNGYDSEKENGNMIDYYGYYMDHIRGVYVGNDFIIIWQNALEIYDMDNGYTLKQTISLT